MNQFNDYLQQDLLKDASPLEIITFTIFFGVSLKIFYEIYNFITQTKFNDIKIFIFRIAKDFIPQARAYIISEKEKVLKDCHEKYKKQRSYVGVIPNLPLKGMDEKLIKERVEKFVGKS